MKELLEKIAEKLNTMPPPDLDTTPHACIETSDGLIDLEFDEESNEFYLRAESNSFSAHRVREVACISLTKENLIELIDAANNALNYLSDRPHQ